MKINQAFLDKYVNHFQAGSSVKVIIQVDDAYSFTSIQTQVQNVLDTLHTVKGELVESADMVALVQSDKINEIKQKLESGLNKAHNDFGHTSAYYTISTAVQEALGIIEG